MQSALVALLSWAACVAVDVLTPATQETSALFASDGEQCLSFRQLRGEVLRANDSEFLQEQEVADLADVSLKQNESTVHGSGEGLSHGHGHVHLPYGHPSSKHYPRYPGFTLWLVEDFDRPIDLDNDPIWTWSDGGLKEGQVRFTKEQIHFSGGKMQIRVQKNTGWQEPCSHAQAEEVPRKPLVSGELRTRYNMFRYGRYEVRMRAPQVQFLKPQVDGNFVASMFVFRAASFHHWRAMWRSQVGALVPYRRMF
eukprot:TRINITY_DN3683_c0_g1_i1.p1 TRINITY_DN3683_c0_g1~~TRINITY_DN3683_c0_g1_i1.p1  ORF type:complete len:253 (-),score=27.01 TRINITY_DN3683_c0_g1_i1:621-1379(-)